MSAKSRVVIVAILVSGLAVPAAAQVPTSPEGVTWYVRNFTTYDGAEAWLSFYPPTDEVDQTVTCTGCAGPDPLTIVIAAEASLPVLLKPAGSAGEAVIYLKSWNNLPAPGTKVTVTVDSGGAVVATGSLTKDVLLGAIVEFVIPLTYSGGDMSGGSLVTMTMTIEDAATGGYNPAAYARGVSPEHMWRFTLPVAPAQVQEDPGTEGLAIEYRNLTGDTVAIEEAFDGSIPVRAIQYNWTSALSTGTIRYSVELTVGEVNLAVLDSDYQVLLDVSNLTSASEVDVSFAEATHGPWLILVLAQGGASGTLALSIDPPAGTDPSNEDPTDDGEGPGDGGNGPGAGPGDGDDEGSGEGAKKKSPGLGLIAALAGIGLVAFVRRRQS